MNRQETKREGESVAAAAIALPLATDQEQLSRLFGEHHRRVLKAAYRITGNLADAEDIAQAVFLRLARGEGELVANVGSYLYRAAINGALDLLRRRKSAPADPLEAASGVASVSRGSSPESEMARRDLGESLRVAISELPERAAEMFTLRYIEDLGNGEIARLMGTSQAVVAVTLFNARAKLKLRLRELEQEQL
jgi:RNA polymerase sigma factor (sigma-70 family)